MKVGYACTPRPGFTVFGDYRVKCRRRKRKLIRVRSIDGCDIGFRRYSSRTRSPCSQKACFPTRGQNTTRNHPAAANSKLHSTRDTNSHSVSSILLSRSHHLPPTPTTTTMIDVKLITAANATYAQTYKDTANPDPRPKKRLAISPPPSPVRCTPRLTNHTVTCMDAWIHEADAFGIALGDAHIIRNAGGSAREGLRSLIVSQQILNTDQVMLVKHTRRAPLPASTPPY